MILRNEVNEILQNDNFILAVYVLQIVQKKKKQIIFGNWQF